MSRSICFNGYDLGECTTAEVREQAAVAVEPNTAIVPWGRSDLLPGGRLKPREIHVTLSLDLGYQPSDDEPEHARRKVSAWLLARDGATLVRPDGLAYRECVLTGCGPWSSNGPDATCELVFLAFDPVAWGEERQEFGDEFDVGGTAPAIPVITLCASPAHSVRIDGGDEHVEVEGPFAGGEEVEIDFVRGTVEVDGELADEFLTISSEYFTLGPGPVRLTFTGCESHGLTYRERWA